MIIWHVRDFLDLLHGCIVAGEEIDNTMRNIYEYHHKFRLQGIGLLKFYLYIQFDPNQYSSNK